ncbi:nitroreductase [Halovivax ruber XH-70]|uniref:Nitroreductase n=2 Tax=Halovivax ruber TaxID=387341 RepID=L0IFR9_HALRX|nr:nitroreductase [Halovivax ruber XH-70]
MEIDVNSLRKLRSQGYEPSQLRMDESYLDEFVAKEFRGEHLAELFHENTKYSDKTNLKLGPSAAAFTKNPSYAYMQAQLSPDYDGYETIDLPEPDSLGESFTDAIERRRSVREQAGESLSLSQLSTLLKHSCGVSAERPIGEEGTVLQEFRSYASGGALYPVEIYLAVVHGDDDLDRGLYYYVPDDHELRVLRRDDELPDRMDDLFALSEDVFDPATSSVVFMLTGAFWRSMAKYGPRGYRYILQESGHLGQNILLSAAAMELVSLPVAAFKDDSVNEYLDVDGVNEAVVYTLCVGHRADSENQ